MPSHIRTDMVDIVIPTCRPAEFAKKLLMQASGDEKWMRHHFIVIFDHEDETEMKRLTGWFESAREHTPLPHLTARVMQHKPGLAALRQAGLNIGMNPFVYFQDDDDPLPDHLDDCIELILAEGWDAVYGCSESMNARSQRVELFPPLIGNEPGNPFQYNPLQASRIFPTYIHPLAALFRRSLFERFPYDNGHDFKGFDNAAFFVRLLFGGAKLTCQPWLIRKVTQHEGNTTALVLDEETRAHLADAIDAWQPEVDDGAIKEVQARIARRLRRGDIITFREVAAHVEEHMEEHGHAHV